MNIAVEPNVIVDANAGVILTDQPKQIVQNDSIVEHNNIKISLFPSRRKTVKKINVIVEGDFNISNVQLVKDNCQRLLSYYDMVSITLKNVTDIDLAAIQLIHVLNSSSAFMQKTITIESELSADDKALILGSGLMEVMSKRK